MSGGGWFCLVIMVIKEKLIYTWILLDLFWNNFFIFSAVDMKPGIEDFITGMCFSSPVLIYGVNYTHFVSGFHTWHHVQY